MAPKTLVERGDVGQALRTLGIITSIIFLGLAGLTAFSLLDSRSKAGELRGLIARNDATLRDQRHSLAEVCRQGHIVQGVIDAQAELVKAQFASRTIRLGGREYVVSSRSNPAVMRALEVFLGYREALAESPACGEVLNP